MSRPDATILDHLHRHAQDQPDWVAFTFLHDNGTTDFLSFRRLEQRAHTLAAQFIQEATPGERALMLYPPGLEFIGIGGASSEKVDASSCLHAIGADVG